MPVLANLSPAIERVLAQVCEILGPPKFSLRAWDNVRDLLVDGFLQCLCEFFAFAIEHAL